MRKVCKTVLLMVAAIGFGQGVSAANLTAKVFEMNADPTKDSPIFKMKHEDVEDGEKKQFHIVYSTMDDNPVIVEDVELHGTDVVSYHLDQRQIGAKAIIEVKDNKVRFSYQKKDEKPKTNEEKYADNLVIGPSLVSYVRKHWSDIKDGKRVSIRFVVPDRLETVGFDLVKDKKSTDEKTVVKMKASSLIISAIVDPLYLTFPSDGSHMTEMSGRSPVKRESDGKFRDFDAHTIYTVE